MDATPQPENRSLDEQLTAARQSLANRLLLGAAGMSVLLIPLALWRAADVGWHLQLLLQLGVMVGAVAAGVWRHRLPLSFKVGCLLALTTSVGLSGVFSLGMTGAGYFWLLLSAALVAVFVSLKAGLLATLAGTALIALAGTGFVSGWLTPPIDLNIHAHSASGWASFLAVMLVAPIVLLFAVGGVQQHLLRLLDQVRAQRDRLEAQGAELVHLASHDHLTDLSLTRPAFKRLDLALAARAADGGRAALMFIDLDRFKLVNDGHGHEVGDDVLRVVAKRLIRITGTPETVARVGGDEFIVMALELTGVETATRMGQEVVDALAQPIQIGALQFSVGASVGLAVFPDHAADSVALRRAADQAMYRAKRAGGGRLVAAGALAPPPGGASTVSAPAQAGGAGPGETATRAGRA